MSGGIGRIAHHISRLIENDPLAQAFIVLALIAATIYWLVSFIKAKKQEKKSKLKSLVDTILIFAVFILGAMMCAYLLTPK